MKITKVSMIFCPHRLNLLNVYQIVKIEDGIYTIVQKQGSYKHKLKLPEEKLNKL